MTRLSVALCTYNGERFLEDQLASIAGQTRPPDEIVVCDDGSTDATLDLAEAFADGARFPVRLYLNQPRLGSTKNFERAISLCDGDVIALADQDDVWHPDKLRRQEDVLACSGAGAVFTDAELVDVRLIPLGRRLWQAVGFTRAEQRRVTSGRAAEVLLRHEVVTGATLAFCSRLRHMLLPIPEEWVHDAWIALLVASLARLVLLDEPLVRYRQHGANQIGAPCPRGFREEVRAAMGSDGGVHLRLAARYKLAWERVRALGEGEDAAAISYLGAKVDHLVARGALPHHALRRLGPIAGELLSARYRRYSAGWKSVGKDLLLQR